MIILGVMQNQYFNDPDKIRRTLASFGDDVARREKYRRRLIAFALFRGCKSGRVLERVFGEELCGRIVWEEASREIGGHASSVFPADVAHLTATIADVQPGVIVGFGQVACQGIERALGSKRVPFVRTIHPAARTNAIEQLQLARSLLDAHLR